MSRFIPKRHTGALTRAGHLAVLLLTAGGVVACHAESDLLRRRDGGADMVSTDRRTTDGASTDDASTDRGSADGGSTDRGSTDGASTADASTDDASTDDASIADASTADAIIPPNPDGACNQLGTGQTAQERPLFDNAFDLPLPPEMIPGAVAVGDVTGDGRADVVLGSGAWANASPYARLYVLPQLASGALGDPIVYPVSETTGSVPELELVDVDGDGRLDVVVPLVGGVGVMFQTASGTLPPAVAFPASPMSATYMTYGVAGTGDLDDDGRTDLIVSGCEPGPICVWLQTAPRSFTGPRSLNGTGPFVGDVNGDGRDDMVGYGPAMGWLDLVLQSPAGGFERSTQILTGADAAQDLGMTDVDGDCRPDLVFTVDGNPPTSHLAVMLQMPSGRFPLPISLPSYAAPWNLVIADVDGDGRDDAVVLHGADFRQIGVYRRIAAGGFAAEELYGFAAIEERGQNLMAVGDIDGDGRPDVVGVDGERSKLTVSYHHRP